MRTLIIWLVLAVFLTASIDVSSADNSALAQNKTLGLLDFFKFNNSIMKNTTPMDVGNASNGREVKNFTEDFSAREDWDGADQNDSSFSDPNILFIHGEEKEVILNQSTQVQDLGIAQLKSYKDGRLRFFFYNVSGGKVVDAYARLTLEQNNTTSYFAQNISGSCATYFTLIPSFLTENGFELNKNVSLKLELLSGFLDSKRSNNLWKGTIKLESRGRNDTILTSLSEEGDEIAFSEDENVSEPASLSETPSEDNFFEVNDSGYVDDVYFESIFEENSEEAVFPSDEESVVIKILNATPLQKKVLAPVKAREK